MKTVRILGFVVIVIIVFFASTDGFKGFKDGWNAVPDISSDINPVSLSVVPDKTLVPDSIYNIELQRNVSYKMNGIETYVSRSNNVYYKFINFVVPFVFFFIYGCYCLVRLLVDICRNQVLTRKNVRRMRFFIYSFMLLLASLELVRYLEYVQVVNEITLPTGYSFDDFGLKGPWMLIMLLVLFVEIFAKAEKIKEENDLTI
ncbi:DUF2975 domain-containing protein [Bacteroides caecigallinarum]|uniref:DUF2975 domain-containing protein n=1 Tax=Bacteroides caecigallinarum TaxID=1411144 RepID=UPI001F213E33|nr:DUF2975 domain-containing protein [Bacteroides caecigallinarum]MCF2593545.1 DUF2975 domain-containing protein [Bacteroides caecigallinarum]